MRGGRGRRGEGEKGTKNAWGGRGRGCRARDTGAQCDKTVRRFNPCAAVPEPCTGHSWQDTQLGCCRLPDAGSVKLKPPAPIELSLLLRRPCGFTVYQLNT